MAPARGTLVTMRAYLPMTLEELALDAPPQRPAVLADTAAHPDAEDLALEDALQEAAFASLELVDASDALPCRIVAVSARKPLDDWENVQSFMVDGADGRDCIRRILAEGDEETAAQLVEDLFELDLEWHDGKERTDLVEHHLR